jgi:hypothetical protein
MNPGRTLKSFVVVLTAVAGLAIGSASVSQAAPGHSARASTAKPATIATFAGQWIGHTRGLKISHKGHAKESIEDGCCDRVINLTLRLRDPKGTTRKASIRATVLTVHVFDHSDFSASNPPPHVGESKRIHLKHGVITETLSQATYCDNAAEARGVCGA